MILISPRPSGAMLFSIVTISLNQAEFLEKTIRSVVEQDYPHIEYIVVDPGSTDGSRDIIESYRDLIDKIIYEPDAGAADGLNKGFGVATGDVYGFLNSDDVLLPGALNRIAAAFALEEDVDIVTGHAYIIDAAGRWLRNSYTDRFNLRAFAYEACSINQLSTYFRADLFKRAGGFNVKNRIAWDAELFLDLFQNAQQTVLLDSFLSAFRVHSGAITGGATMTPALRRFEDEKFERIVGRPRKPLDRYVRLLWLARKYLLEPRSLWQRLRFGSIYGRYSSTRSRR